ncbi:hypothetical protein A4U53_031085 [Rhizobium ruizarguesonis]|uniref:Uncharacterized protein n=2 Tax=Rhizobium TaxID=379 RepID=A0A179BU16_RHILE|nr:hypothetical protein [Rhizobium leguminosarum]OAP95147.1 hypothetical protein A4U53_18165 [Rhizobium leguminosarum]
MAYESTPVRLEIRNKLVDAFLQVSAQGLITHKEIADLIGKKTTSPDAIKHSAFRVASDEHGIVFENIRGTGYRRIAAGDVHRVGTQTRHSIRGKVKRGSKKILAVLSTNSNSMTNGERIKAHAELGILGMIRMAAGRGAAAKAYREAERHEEKYQKPPTQEEISKAVLRALAGKAA